MHRNNPHIVRVKSDPVFGDCPEWQDRYAREHGGARVEYEARCLLCGWVSDWLPGDYALEVALEHQAKYEHSASQTEREMIEEMGLSLVLDGYEFGLDLYHGRKYVDTFMEVGGDDTLLATDMIHRIDRASLNHLRTYHLRPERDEHGKVVGVSYVPECTE